MIQDRIDSGNLHVHVSTPKNTAQHVRVDTTGVTTSLFASGPAQSITGSSNSLSQVCLRYIEQLTYLLAQTKNATVSTSL